MDESFRSKISYILLMTLLSVSLPFALCTMVFMKYGYTPKGMIVSLLVTGITAVTFIGWLIYDEFFE